MTKDFSPKLLVLIFTFALFGGALGGGITVNFLNSQAEAGSSKIVEKVAYLEESQIIDTVKKASPAVVSIVVSKDLPLYKQRVLDLNDFFGSDPFSNFNSSFTTPELERDADGNVRKETQKIGGGSGFIITEDGLVVTNRHVVQDEEATYTVVLNDGSEYTGEVLSRDTLNDIAVLQVVSDEGKSVSGLPTISLGDSDQLQVGQRVIAIGNALAQYENTVTTGVISAKGRSLTAGSVNSAESLRNLIQTDAAINPGNSGGPLVNLNGEVVGINTAIAANGQSIGFAIPVSDVVNAIESVKEHGKIIRPFLGVRFMMLDETKAKELQIDVNGGALLVGNEAEGEFAVVPGSPADKAGLKIKDVVLEVDGEAVTVDKPLHLIVNNKQPGDTIELKVWRSGEIILVKVKLEETK